MNIGTSGLLLDSIDKILLIRRNDSRTWAMPGGGMEAGELPADSVAREVREETGLISMPVRLVSLQFTHMKPEPHLVLTFRCIQRGGEIETSEESPEVGFVKVSELPNGMGQGQRQRIETGLAHRGGAPLWFEHHLSWYERFAWFMLRRIVYPRMDRRREREGRSPYVPPPQWETSAFTVIRNEVGEVLWVKRPDHDVWNLPGGMAQHGEPPWETAVRETYEETGLQVSLSNLTGIYVYEDEKPHMVFTFTASATSGELTTGAESSDFAYFAPGSERLPLVEQHLQRVSDALDPIEHTQFRMQKGPSLVIKKL